MKERRKELGLSAEYVAEKLGVSPATIYRYEKGEIEKMPGNILEPISQILRTTPAYLMGWDEPRTEMAPAPRLPASLTFKLARLDGADQAKVEAYAKILYGQGLIAEGLDLPDASEFNAAVLSFMV